MQNCKLINLIKLFVICQQYDQYKTPMENIGLQDSLLSRFDLLFVMLDLVDSEQDQRISDFVVRMHRYRNPKEQDGEVLPMGGNYADLLTTFNLNADNETKELPMYEKYDALLHGESRSRQEQILSVNFMRKYIHLAKCMKPKLTESAAEVISNEYSRLRSEEQQEKDMARTQPVTPRTLETLIRLSTAHAKARMGQQITVIDAQAAIELVQFAYFKKVLEKEKRKRRRSEDGGESTDEETMDTEQTEPSQPSVVSPSSRRQAKRTRTNETESYDFEDSEDMQMIQPPDAGDLTKRTTRKSVSAQSSEQTPTVPEPDFISPERFAVFKQRLNQAFRDAREQTLAVERLTAIINQNADEAFRQPEINAAVELMSEANQIMVADGMVFLI